MTKKYQFINQSNSGGGLMSIRIRVVNGHTIAICANLSLPKEGDIYLGDSAHHALTTKFGVDFWSEGTMSKHFGDNDLIKLMRQEQNGNLESE